MPTAPPLRVALSMIIGAGALCAACQSYTTPRFELTGTKLTEESDEGYVLRFAFEGTNTNDVELPLDRVRYSLRLDGREVFRGMRSSEATLPRHGTQSIALPAAVALAPGQDVPEGEVGFVITGEVEYHLPGSIAEVLFDANLRRPQARFSASGRLDFGEASGLSAAPAP